jgi:hypothetical protein
MANCDADEALSNYRDVQSFPERYDSVAAITLNKLATAALMDCYERQDLRLAMLAGGVNAHEIDRLDLSAKNASNVSLHYFAEGCGNRRPRWPPRLHRRRGAKVHHMMGHYRAPAPANREQLRYRRTISA